MGIFEVRMIRKINWKIILLQVIGVFLLSKGVERIYLVSIIDIYEAVMLGDFDRVDELTDIPLGELIIYEVVWKLVGIGVGTLLVILRNWLSKISFWNSSIVIVLTLVLFWSEQYLFNWINWIVNSIGYLFTEDMKLATFINGCYLILAGVILIFLKDFKKQKSLEQNEPLDHRVSLEEN